MFLSIDQYFTYILTTSQWKEIKNDLLSSNQILKIPMNIFKSQFPIIKKSDLSKMNKVTKKRVVFDTEEEDISAKSHHRFIKIRAKVELIYNIEPYPKKIYLQCKGCNKKWTENVKIPIANPNPKELLCGQSYCSNFIANKPYNSYNIEYINTFKFNLIHNNISIKGFIINDPIIGFKDIVQKIQISYEFDADIILYGFCSIHRTNNHAEYYLEVQDVDILDRKTKKKLIPFLSYEEPTTEKEMVMGSFFTNLEYMKNYLNFETYQLQRKYPDLILNTKNGRMIVEFEHDVANFYAHKHYEQEPKCDLIIAWQCSTKKKDYPYLLIKSLRGTFISERKIWNNPLDIFQKLINILTIQFQTIDPSSIPFLVIPIIDTIIPIQTIEQNKIKLVYPQFVNWKCVDFLIEKEYVNHIILSDDGIKIPINTISTYTKNESFMDDIFDVKEYLQYIRKKKLSPPILYEKGIVGFLYGIKKNIEYTDFLLILSSLMANFFQLQKIEINFVEYIFQIFPSLK